MLTLFYAPNACSLASHIALEDAGAAFEAVRIDTAGGQQRTADYHQINPKGRVPALATERGILTESPAILAYIALRFAQARLAPIDDPFAFAEVQAFNNFISSSVHIAFAHVFRPARFAEGEDAAAAMRAFAPVAIGDYLGLIEERLADGRPYVHGDAYSISDPYLFVMARWLARDGVGDANRFPLILAHRARMNLRPSVRKVLAREGLAVI